MEQKELKIKTTLGTATLGKVYASFLGDEKIRVNWGDKPTYPWLFDSVEEEKKLFWFREDLHYPLIYTPLQEDIFNLNDSPVLTNPGRTAMWMFDRYWYPTGVAWIVRRVGGRVYQAIVPPPDEEVEARQKYFNTVYPVYARDAPKMWKRIVEQTKRNLEYMDSIIEDAENLSMAELLVAFQDFLDILEQHGRYHWQMGFAHYLMTVKFIEVWKNILGENTFSDELYGNLAISLEDQNWRRLHGLYELKEKVKASRELADALTTSLTYKEFKEKIEKSDEGKQFLKEIEAFLKKFGWVSPYAHKLEVESWIENPDYFFDQLKYYYDTDFNYDKEYAESAARKKKAMEEFEKLIKSANLQKEKEEELRFWYNAYLRLCSFCPDHHFYFEQSTDTRVGFLIRYLGKRLAQMGVVEDYRDVFYLRYNEFRLICADPKAFNAKAIIKERKEKIEEEYRNTPYVPFVGTATEWALEKEFWRVLWGWDTKTLKERLEQIAVMIGKKPAPSVLHGIATGTGVAEGTAKVVMDPKEFDKVKEGDVVIAIMTSPAWTPILPRISGLVTDSGNIMSHPAIMARVYGFACVVGTQMATSLIKDGQRIRVDGNRGVVEILE